MLEDSQLEALKAPFPDNAITEDRSRGFMLHSVKAAYIVERLNDVFGVCGIGWRYAHSPIENANKEVTTEVALQYRGGNCEAINWHAGWTFYSGERVWSEPIFAHGGKKIGGGGSPLGDAKKSAVTDGITKAASMLGVAHHIFKGLGATRQSDETVKKSPPKKKEEVKDLKDLQTASFMLTPDECKEQGLDIGGYATYVVDLVKGVEHKGETYYENLNHRKNLYKQLFGDEDFWDDAVLGWFRLLERYALALGEASDDDFEDVKEHAKKVVEFGVKNQVDWDGAVEGLDD